MLFFFLYYINAVLFNFYSSKNPEKSITGSKKKKASQLFPTLIMNQHIRMISKRSCDTEDWSNDAENAALHIKYIKIENCYFNLQYISQN